MKLPILTSITSLQLFQLMRFGGFFLTGILLVQLGTPLSVVGTYEKLMFIAGIASFFWVQGIITTLLSNYQSHKEKKVYLFNVFLLISFLSLLVFILLRLFKVPIENLMAGSPMPGYNYLTIYILFNAPCFIIEAIYILYKKSLPLICYGLISTIGTVSAVVIPIAYGYTIESSIAILTLWSALRYLWLLRVLLQYIIPIVKTEYIKYHLTLSVPLILSFVVAGSAEYIDGFLVTRYFSPEQFAIFRYGARELPLSLLMANALSTAIIPLIKSDGETNYGLVKSESRKLMKLIFPVSIFLLFSSHFIYSFFFNTQFTQSAAIFNIYILLAISRTLLPQSIIYALNGSKALLRISIIEILINVTASYLLMQHFGLAGIAMGTVIAHFSEKWMMGYYLYKRHKIKPGEYIPSLWYWHVFLLIMMYLLTICIF